MVQQAGENMEVIVASVKKVTSTLQEITLATASQSEGIREVSEAMSHLEQLTQQNAALVEQSAATAEAMKTQSQRLTRVISTFQLASDGATIEPNGNAAAQFPTVGILDHEDRAVSRAPGVRRITPPTQLLR